MKIVAIALSVLLAFSGAWTENETDTALNCYGGIVAVYEVSVPEDEALSDMDSTLKAAEEIIKTRLDDLSYSSAEVEPLGKNRLMVVVPGAQDIESLAGLTKPATLEFLDFNGNVFMNSDQVLGASANYGPIGNGTQNEYHVVIEFTKAGREIFTEETAKAASLASIGENYIDIEFDGYNISHASVYEAIVSDIVTISGEFDGAEAKQLATLINNSKVSFEAVLLESTYTEPAENADKLIEEKSKKAFEKAFAEAIGKNVSKITDEDYSAVKYLEIYSVGNEACIYIGYDDFVKQYHEYVEQAEIAEENPDFEMTIEHPVDLAKYAKFNVLEDFVLSTDKFVNAQIVVFSGVTVGFGTISSLKNLSEGSFSYCNFKAEYEFEKLDPEKIQKLSFSDINFDSWAVLEKVSDKVTVSMHGYDIDENGELSFYTDTQTLDEYIASIRE